MKKFIKIFNILMVLTFVFALSGCGENYEKLSLRFSTSSVELCLNEEKVYQITVDNYFETKLNFDFSFDNDVAKVEEKTDLGGGEYQIKIKAISAGQTILNITLLENKSKIQIPVNVYEEISSVKVKSDENLYVLRGSSITFSKSMFNFEPSSTLQTDLTFSVNGENIQSNTFVSDNSTPSEITVVATSVYNSSIKTQFTVKVVDEIKFSELNNTILYEVGQDVNTPLLPIGSANESTIEIFANDETNFEKNLQFVFDSANDYKYTFLSKNGNFEIQKSIRSDFENVIFLQLQQLDHTKDLTDELILRISHTGYDNYYVDVNYKVEVKLIPKNIKLNGNKNNLQFDLFDNQSSQNTQEVMVTIDPQGAIFDKIDIGFSLVDTNDGETIVSYKDIKQYICIKKGGLELNDTNNQIEQNKSISFYGIKVLGSNYKNIRIYFKASSSLLGNETLSNYVDISIKKGAKKMYVDPIYTNGTIYIRKGDTQSFNGLVIEDSDAYIGTISVACETSYNGYSSVSQQEINQKTLTIQGINVGQTMFTLTLQNGIVCQLKVVVKEQLSLEDFVVQLSQESIKDIAHADYQDKKATLKAVYVAGSDIKFNVDYTIKPNDVDETMYSISLQSENISVVDIVNQNTIKTILTTGTDIKIKVNVTIKIVKDFKLALYTLGTGDYGEYNFDFVVNCYNPISSVSLVAKNDGLKDQDYSTSSKCYLNPAYTDSSMSKMLLKLAVNGQDVDISDKYWQDVVWGFSVDSVAYDINGKRIVNTKTGNVEYYVLSKDSVDYGTFYPKTGEFICGTATQSENKGFYISASLDENGQIFSAKTQIDIVGYKKVSNLWLKNYEQEIYFDSTQNEKVLYPYVYPFDATNTNFEVKIISNEGSSIASCLSYYVEGNQKITLTYNGNGAGSGELQIIPYSSYTNNTEYNKDAIAVIKINIGDGETKENPLHISTWEQFKNIDLNKYYKVQGTINAYGEEIAPLGVLKGGILGGKDAKIQNFVVKNPKNIDNVNYYGLFSQIDKFAYVEDITIQGSINISNDTKDKEAQIGLLAGKNSSLNINNVHIILESGSISVSGEQVNYIGGMFGYNDGNITIQHSKDLTSTLFVEMIQTFTLNLTSLTSAYYFGGIVGYNKGGTISFEQNEAFARYNNYGKSVITYQNVRTGQKSTSSASAKSCTGGVVGFNDKGSLVNLLVCGQVNRQQENNYRSNNVGGVVGYALGGSYEKITTRTYIAGKNNIAGLIGYLEVDSSTKIEDCEVQALDYGYTDLNASMIISYNGTVYNKVYNANKQLDNFNQDDYARTFTKRDKVSEKTDSELNYYGDLLCFDGSSYNGVSFNSAGQSSLSLANMYESSKYPNNTIIMMFYKSSVGNDIITQKNKQYLPKDLFRDTTIEYTITSSDTSIMSVDSNGRLNLFKTGKVTLYLQNVFNKFDSLDLTVFVTNYISNQNSLVLFTNPNKTDGKINENLTSTLINQNKLVLYPKISSTIFEIGIVLEENTDAKVKVLAENQDKLDILQTNNAIFVNANDSTEHSGEIKFYLYIDLGNGDERYFNGSEFVPIKSISQATIKDYVDELVPNVSTLKYRHSLEVYDFSIDKSDTDKITLVPSDTIRINATYKSQQDTPQIQLEIYYIDGNDYLTEDEISEYFDVSVSQTKNESEYKSVYQITMKEDKIRIGSYKFNFIYGTNGIKTLYVDYLSQPIDNVAIRNYNDFNDINIIKQKDESGKDCYNTSYAMQESQGVVAGGTNVLRVNITPYYADYSYIEVTNSTQNISNGRKLLFSQLLQKDNADKRYITAQNHIASGGEGIRVYKNEIQNGDLTVLYSLYENVVEDSTVDIVVNVYNSDGEKLFSEMKQTYNIQIEKDVTVKIKRDNISSDTKYIARGYTYALDVNYKGYAKEEIHIISNSPYLTINSTQSGYSLKVSDYVSYGSVEGANVSLTYYGERKVNGITVKSSIKTLELVIVEYVLDFVNTSNIDSLFEDSPLELNVKNTIKDIRELLANKIKLEYSQNATNGVSALKQNIINNALFTYQKDNSGFTFGELTNDTSFENKYVKLNGYTLTPLYVGENAYSFQIGIGKLVYQSGYITVDNSDISNISYKKIGVNVNQSIASGNYLPISSYDALMSMKPNLSYRLTNDITIGADFTPIETEIKELDGNGYSLILESKFDYEDISNFGIFEEIASDTVIKNLTIQIKKFQQVIFNFSSSANDLNFGLLAGTNKGTINNCKVICGNETSSLVVNNYSATEYTAVSNIAVFVAKNEGDITNCDVELKVEAQGANLSGFVSENEGHIASCYVKNSLIKNSSQDAKNSTSGFVKINRGKIINSYVEGKYLDGKKRMYAENTSYSVIASSISSTFVYNNKGTISDCYANIPIISSSQNSGFVCTNEGTISNSYTTSKLGDNDTQNYPFIISNVEGKGELKNCFFLSDTNFNVKVNSTNDNFDQDVLRKTTLLEFALNRVITSKSDGKYIISSEEIFSTFVFNDSRKLNQGIWFYAKDTKSILDEDIQQNYEQKQDIEISRSDYIKYTQNVSNADSVSLTEFKNKGENMSFVSNRPQLVSANVLTYSKFDVDLDKSVVSEETGEITYYYVLNSECEYEGSIYNPILISSASQLENEVYNSALKTKNVYTRSLRLITDIDYTEEKITVSSLYKVIFAGTMDGNGLTISGYSLNTNEAVFNGGYFGQIGYNGYDACIQNIVFTPNYINMPNAKVVGGICGTLYMANVYNVEIATSSQSKTSLTVIGKNLVGGLFGRTQGTFEIKNAKSTVSANAVNICQFEDWTSAEAQNSILFNEYTSNTTTVSYSGTIIGYVGGFGTVQNVSSSDCASVGMISGLMFGGVGLNATVSYINLNPIASDKTFVRASVYGGILAGEIRGTATYIEITSPSDNVQDSNIFKNYPIVAQAIGGVCGILRDGTLDHCECTYDISASYNAVKSDASGGFVGKLSQNGTITNSSYTGTVVAVIYVGGLVGETEIDVSYNSNILIDNCKIDAIVKIIKPASKTINSLYVNVVYIGSVIGYVGYTLDTSLKDEPSTTMNIQLNSITIKTTYNVEYTIYGNTGVGSQDGNIVWDYDFIGGGDSNVQKYCNTNQYLICIAKDCTKVSNITRNYVLKNLDKNDDIKTSSSDSTIGEDIVKVS